MKHRVKVFFDGGARPNPGTMEIAVVAAGQTYIQHDVGHGTNTDAEWLALIAAFTIAQSLGSTNFVLIGDAAGVVGQANGTMKCRRTSIRYRDAFRLLVSANSPPRIRHVKRSHNLAGIALAGLHGARGTCRPAAVVAPLGEMRQRHVAPDPLQ